MVHLIDGTVWCLQALIMGVGGFKMVFGNLFVIGTCSDMINGKHGIIIELRKYLHRTFCQLHVLEYRRSKTASGIFSFFNLKLILKWLFIRPYFDNCLTLPLTTD